MNVSLTSKNIYRLFENTIKETKKDDSQEVKEQWSRYNVSPEYQEILEKFQVRKVTTEPEIQKPPLLQLLLRGFFGVNARAEVLLYLLYEKEGSSNQIAKTVQFDQKIVYRILEKWTNTGFIAKESGRKYILAEPDLFSNFLRGADDSVNYLDWIKTFHVLARVMKAIHTGKWQSDIYLLSSFFRHITEETKRLARYLNIAFPQSSLFKGEEYLFPFMEALRNILSQL